MEKKVLQVLLLLLQDTFLAFPELFFLLEKCVEMDTFPTLPITQELNFFVYSLNLYSIFPQACRSLILTVAAMTIMLIFNTFLFSIKTIQKT